MPSIAIHVKDQHVIDMCNSCEGSRFAILGTEFELLEIQGKKIGGKVTNRKQLT